MTIFEEDELTAHIASVPCRAVSPRDGRRTDRAPGTGASVRGHGALVTWSPLSPPPAHSGPRLVPCIRRVGRRDRVGTAQPPLRAAGLPLSLGSHSPPVINGVCDPPSLS